MNKKILVSTRTLATGSFYFAYFLFLAFSMFGHIPVLGGYLKEISNIGTVLLIALFLIRIRIYTAKEGIIFAILFLYSFFVIFKTGFYGFFKLVLMIATSKGINLRKCLRYDLVGRTILVTIMLILFCVGIAPDVVSVYEDGYIRHSMGFENPNHIGLALFIMVSEIFLLNNFKVDFLTTLIVGVMLWLERLSSASKTCEMMVLLMFGLSFIYTVNPIILGKKNVLRLITWAFPICALLTLIMTIIYVKGIPFGSKLNEFMSDRLRLIDIHLKYAGLHALGTKSGGLKRTIDNFYAFCLIYLGPINFLLIMCACVRLERRLGHKNIPVAIVVACFAMYGISERLWMYCDYNIMLLVFRELIYGDVPKSQECESSQTRNCIRI